MPLPDNFSPWEHLQSVVRQVHNRRVREEFTDLDGIEDLDINAPRQSLKLACLLKDDDSADMTIIRLMLFFNILRGGADLWPDLYTIPTDRYQQTVRFAPQVTLLFRQDLDDVDQGFRPIEAEISFRLKNETPQTLTEAECLSLANRIRSEFATGAGYQWRKGRTKLAYRDRENGYQFSIFANTVAEGRSVISKILDIQNDTLDGSKLTISELGEPPPIIPPTDLILGQVQRLPRIRPVGSVRFQLAELHVWGVKKPVILVDRTGRRRNALISA